MKKSITKEQIIEALKTEPLRRGDWFQNETKAGCSVCAVGAVLRKMSFETWARENKFSLNTLGWDAVGGYSTPIRDSGVNWSEEHLEEKNYLAALSCVFEGGATRKQCIQFVKDNFPAKLTLEINR